MIFVIATLRIKPGSLPSVIEAAQPCLAATRLEQGCISYDLHANVTDPETVVFVERWATRDALSKHFEMPHLKAWRDAGGPHIVSRTVEIVHSDHVEVL